MIIHIFNTKYILDKIMNYSRFIRQFLFSKLSFCLIEKMIIKILNIFSKFKNKKNHFRIFKDIDIIATYQKHFKNQYK